MNCCEKLTKEGIQILAKNSSLFCIVVVYSTRLLHNQLMLRFYNVVISALHQIFQRSGSWFTRACIQSGT